MKSLKIGEISQTYGIGIDSLRYYEKIGLLRPKRTESNYREYDYFDLWRLNIIKELKDLNFSLQKIKKYLDNRNLETTKNLMIEEIRAIDYQIESLSALKQTLSKKLDFISNFILEESHIEVSVKTEAQRNCILFSKNIEHITQIDYYFRKLQIKTKDSIPLIGKKSLCIFMPIDKLDEENFYSQVFTAFPDNMHDNHRFDFFLPAGLYLSVFYIGPHYLSNKYTRVLVDYAQENNYDITSKPFEICHIDVHETSNQQEYVTEIQLGVKKQVINNTL